MITVPVLTAIITTSTRGLPAGDTNPLRWVAPPPTTGALNTDIIATWGGGSPPYHAIIFSGTVEENNQTGPATSITANIDGTNEPAGKWTWTVTDADGATITADTDVS